MDYRDFMLWIAPPDQDNQCGLLARAPNGTTLSHSFRFPTELIPDGVEKVSAGTTRNLTSIELEIGVGPSISEVGDKLYRLLFANEIGDLLGKQKRPLRLKIWFTRVGDIASPSSAQQMLDLHALPWEALEGRHWSPIDVHHSITRFVEGPAAPVYALPEKLRVLVIAAQNRDQAYLDLDKELEILRRLAGNNLEISCMTEATRAELHDRLEEGFHALHYMGHGGFHQGKPVLFFEDRPLSGEDLQLEINVVPPEKRPVLFFLNACHSSALHLGPSGLSGIATDLVGAGIPAVVAMRKAVPDQVAIAFSGAFYRGLSRGYTLDRAVTNGRHAIYQTTAEDTEHWSLPVLYSKIPDGRLFEIPEVERRRFPLALMVAMILLLTSLIIYTVGKLSNEVELAIINSLPRELEDVVPTTLLGGMEGISISGHDAEIEIEITLEGKSNSQQLRVFVKRRGGESLGEIQLNLPREIENLELLETRNRLGKRILEVLDVPNPAPEIDPNAWLVYQEAKESMDDLSLERALELCREAIEIQADFPDPINMLAMLESMLGNHEVATSYMARVIEIVPNYPVFHYNAGIIYRDQGRLGEALGAFDDALSLDQGFVEALIASAQILIEENNPRRALKRLETAMLFEPERGAIYKYAAKAWEMCGDRVRADEAYNKALAAYRASGDVTEEWALAAYLGRPVEDSGEQTIARGMSTDDGTMSWRSYAGRQILTQKARNLVELRLLTPMDAIYEPRPRIAFSPVGEVVLSLIRPNARRLTHAVDPAETERPKGITAPVGVISWPKDWPSLVDGESWRLVLEDRGRTSAPFQAELTLAPSRSMQTLISELVAISAEQNRRGRDRATSALYEAHGLYWQALTTLLSSDWERRPEDRLSIAKLYHQVGLIEPAVDLVETVIAGEPPPILRARAEVVLGLCLRERMEYEAALEHLGVARALFHYYKLHGDVAWMDRVVDDIERLMKLEVSVHAID